MNDDVELRVAHIHNLRRFVIRWVFATTSGWIIGHFVGVILIGGVLALAYEGFGYDLRNPDGIGPFEPISRLMCFPTAILAMGFLGTLHWWLSLKFFLDNQRIWIIASAVSGIFLGVIGIMLFTQIALWFQAYLGGTGFVTLIGFILSLPQWLVLRRYMPLASRWMLVNIIGVAVSYLLLNISAVIVHRDFYILVYLLVVPIVFGTITGLALYRLLQNPKSP